MISSKITIYSDIECLDQIAIDSSSTQHTRPLEKLTEILHSQANVCVNLNQEELDAQWDIDTTQHSDLLMYCIAHDIPCPIPLSEYFDELKNNDANFLVHPDAVFWLNIPPNDAKIKREQLGMMVLCPQDINDDIFQLQHEKGFRDGTIIPGTGNGWEEMYKTKKFPPINTVVLSDNFFMVNWDSRKHLFYGPENLINLLGTILPQKLSVICHVLIISNHPNRSVDACNIYVDDLIKRIKALRNYDILVEVVFTKKTLHRRHIYTNYYSIRMDKGISVFYIEPSNKGRDENLVTLSSYHHDPLGSSGDTGQQLAYDDIEDLRQICKQSLENQRLDLDWENRVYSQPQKIENRLVF